jgi:glycosyltransferase involved in cell wall biosynthesis
MNVTFCAYDLPDYVGGPNTWLRRILPELRQRGVEPRVLFLVHKKARSQDEYPTLTALRRAGFDVRAIPRPYYTEPQVRWLLEQLAEDPPDVFVPNLALAGFYAARWVREAGIPTVGLLRADNPFHLAVLDAFVDGDPAYRLSALVCVSRYLEHLARRRSPTDVVIARMPSAVPIPEETAQAPAHQLRLMYSGRLVEVQKRISEVTHALCRVVREVPGTVADIYGEGKDRPAVERILRTHGAGAPVQLAGRVDSSAIQEHMLQHHVLVLLSDYEGLSVAVMEAMACGLVPVCLQMGKKFDELVEDHVTGLVVQDRGDHFVAAIRRLREEPELWERLSQAARARVEQEFSIQVIADRWVELLQQLQSAAPPRQQIAIPRQLDLPPVHRDLANEDYRQPPAHLIPVALAQRLVRSLKYRLSRYAGLVRR